MDEKQLNDMLSTLKAPAPNEERRKAAFSAAMAAFDTNSELLGQGDDDSDRLTDRNNKTVRRSLMQRSHRVSGLAGGVALCALVAVLGMPFFTHQVDDIINISAMNGAGTDLKNKVGTGYEDEVYKKAIMAENAAKAREAAARGGSAIPVPIAPAQNEQLSVPPSSVAVQSGSNYTTGTLTPGTDQLGEWRQKAEARRLNLESETAPAEADASIAQTVEKGQLADDRKEESRSVPQKTEAKKAKDSDRADKLARAANKPAGAPSSEMAYPVEQPKASRAYSTEAEQAAIAPRDRLVVMPEPRPAPYTPPYYQQQNGSESFPDYVDNTVKATSAEPVSTFSIDVDTASYAFVRRSINQGQLPPKGSVRLEELINYFPYTYELPAKGEDPFKPTIAVYKTPWNAEHKLVHIGIKGYDLTDKPKSNMVFLIDTSGSMNSPDKLPLVISSFKLMLDGLNPDDTIGIVTYAGSSGVALEPTKVSNRSKIMAALNNLSSGGSTAGAAGIEAAYGLARDGFVKEGNNRVILATDGDFNVGISNPDELKNFIAKKRTEGVFLSVLGFGRGNYQDATMQALAQNGNGNASYIDNLSEARKVLVQEAGSTLFTIAKDVKIQVEFNPAIVQEYRLIGYETRHLNREDFNNDKIDAGEIGAGHTVTAIYEITPVGATPVTDNLRYGAKEIALAKDDRADKSEFGNEIAFLKMRYKRPDSDTSTLMTRPITSSDEKDLAELPDDLRFAASVAGFGQLLRDSQYTNSLTWDQVIDMATKAKGKDEFGYRAEFINLLRLAKSESGQK
ncbi:MAG: VWA domain-containing protein [bacterium]|nr:VWA domain-containing protein [bacterium]